MITMVSRRGGGGGVHPDGPLRHAALSWRPDRGRSTVEALCGAQVATHLAFGFDTEHPRACRGCVTAVST